MLGNILDYNIQSNSGLISGDDGLRYAFVGAEWMDSSKFPVRGLRVDFEVREGNAAGIFLAVQNPIPAQTSSFVKQLSDYQGFYRSTDERMFGGVCGGLAHKWGMSHSAVQLIFFIGGFFYGITILIYVICCIAFKPLPTKNIKVT